METDPREMLPFLDMVRNVTVFMGGSYGGPKYLKVFEKPMRRYMYRRNWDNVLEKANNAAPGRSEPERISNLMLIFGFFAMWNTSCNLY